MDNAQFKGCPYIIWVETNHKAFTWTPLGFDSLEAMAKYAELHPNLMGIPTRVGRIRQVFEYLDTGEREEVMVDKLNILEIGTKKDV